MSLRHFALIPMIFMLIGTFILWRFFDLTPEKVKINKEKIHLALIPMIFMILGLLIFKKMYDLTPDKVNENQLKIKEKGL